MAPRVRYQHYPASTMVRNATVFFSPYISRAIRASPSRKLDEVSRSHLQYLEHVNECWQHSCKWYTQVSLVKASNELLAATHLLLLHLAGRNASKALSISNCQAATRQQKGALVSAMLCVPGIVRCASMDARISLTQACLHGKC